MAGGWGGEWGGERGRRQNGIDILANVKGSSDDEPHIHDNTVPY